MHPVTERPLAPFGLEILAPESGTGLDGLPADWIKGRIATHRLLVLRGFTAPADEAMLAFCGRLGTVLEWEFGAVNELQVRPDAANYLYTNRAVPFHWDGAFIGRIPHIIFFHCRTAPPENTGGETTFCDTTRLLASLPQAERDRWADIHITYSTEKVVHYGGTFTSPLLARHPVTGEAVVRYAEPVEDLNPVRLEIEGIPDGERPAFLARMHDLLNDPAWCREHAWREDDVVLADNHALLHGRRAFARPAARHLRRVNVL